MGPASEIATAQVLHWNQPTECIQTVNLFAAVPGVRVQVVDNASTPANLAQLRAALPPETSLIELGCNLGWGPGHNAGLRRWLNEGSSEFCLIAAHDARPQIGCIEALLAEMLHSPRLGALCPRYPSGEVGKFNPVRGPRIVPWGIRPKALSLVDFAHGTLTVYRRAALVDSGLFDERYFAYGDEIEISLRMRERGWDVGQLWNAVVVNPGTCTPQPVVAYLSSRNSLLLARDYGGRASVLVRTVLMLCNSFRMLLLTSVARRSAFFPKARTRAVCSYFRGEYGPPPATITAGPEPPR